MNFSMIENLTDLIFMSLVLSAIPLMTVKTLDSGKTLLLQLSMSHQQRTIGKFCFNQCLMSTSPCVDLQVPAVIAPEPVVSTEADHDIEVAHMDNNPSADFT
ncbi:hypothetical protein Tco_0843514, partial [Tanacetum coccineum]